MLFLSNGDFILPFHFPAYWAEHFYMWSFQQGAANPDGIIRLPARFIDILVFAALGNVATAYFYIVTCLGLAFLAFFWFARTFLDVRHIGVVIIGALFFALNPIFLGNLSKIGLLLAVAMLPLALTALQQAFVRRRFSFLLLYVAALNVSLVHPFTFSINLAVSGIYLIYLVRANSVWVRDNLHKFALAGITALLLCAYFILPLAALGTVDKGALSDTVTTAPVDYTSLVDVANTGDIFTGLSLSKAVLKDYDFYGAMTWPFYFLGIFAFYAMLFGIYVKVEKRMKPYERRKFVLSLAVFLLLLALSTATFLYADVLIKFLIGLPGGWMFRSPLKWQLYMPLVLFTALVVVLKYVRPGKGLKGLYVAFGITFLLMNGYLFTQIYQRLLTPRHLTYFGQLAETNLEHKNLLFVNSNQCMAFARDNSGVTTELNQIFLSKAVQVKRIGAGSIDTVHLGQYDYVMGCNGTIDPALLKGQYAFERTAVLAGTYEIYRNVAPAPYIYATPSVFALTEPYGLGGKNNFVAGVLAQPFSFVLSDQQTYPATGLQDAFENLKPKDIANGALATTVKPLHAGKQKIFSSSKQPLYYDMTAHTITFSTQQIEGGSLLTSPSIETNVKTDQSLKIIYKDSLFDNRNAVKNPSLEDGLWQQKVGDCNAYNDEAVIGMRLDKTTKTKGKQSLELTAKQHIACTGPADMPVKPGEHYLLSFDYQSNGGQYAGYFVGFDNAARTATGERLAETNKQWQSFTTELVVPAGAKQLHLLTYAYPDGAPGREGKAYYDNFSLIRIPAVKNTFFIVNGQSAASEKAPRVEYTVVNPTKSLMHVTDAKQPFYVSTKESYNRLWQLTLNNNRRGANTLVHGTGAKTVADTDHLRINGSMNGWYIDPASLCNQTPAGCTVAADGSYDIQLIMAFTPQRWFYLGSLISIATAVCVCGFVVYDVWRHTQKKGVRS